MKKKKRQWPTIEFGSGYVLQYVHNQYFWFGPEHGGGRLNASKGRQNIVRFCKQVLKAKGVM